MKTCRFVTVLLAAVAASVVCARAQEGGYLKVDSDTSLVTSFAPIGGSHTYKVSTDAESWTIENVPDFCMIMEQTEDSFTLKCAKNDDLERSGQLTVRAGEHEVFVTVRQIARPLAKINSIWVDYDVTRSGRKGMLIHIDFEIKGLKGHAINPVAYFSYEDGTDLADRDGYYCTVDGQVSVSSETRATYDYSTWENFAMFMPYDQLHVTRKKRTSLSFMVQIRDETSGNMLVGSDNHYFTYTDYNNDRW